MAKSKRNASWTWTPRALGSEGAPLVLCDAGAYAGWQGNDGEGPADFAEVLDIGGVKVVLVDTEGGGPVTVGTGDGEVVIAMSDGDYEEAPKRFAKVLTAIASNAVDEYLVGELELGEALIVADGAITGQSATDDRVRLTLEPGRYVIAEGTHENDDGWETRWCRVCPAGRRKYGRRPPTKVDDPALTIMERVSFATPEKEARALESALELVALGRPDLALEICAKASSGRRALASQARVIALAAARDPRATAEASALATSWLAPAKGPEDTNQALSRASVLRAVDAALEAAPDETLQLLRARVVDAPEPDVFIADGDTF